MRRFMLAVVCGSLFWLFLTGGDRGGTFRH